MWYKIFAPVIILFLAAVMPSFKGSEEIPLWPAGETDFSAYIRLNDTSLNPTAFSLAVSGLQTLSEKGIVPKPELLTLIDYSLPSSACRMYVIDLNRNIVLYKTFVAHGRNSGELFASRFSNRMQSHQSALGFYITGNTYQGSQGYSLILNGVDTGFNDNAVKRAVVMHGAGYVSAHYVEKYGRLGRSFGCPALPGEVSREIIDHLRDGSVVFCYYPDSSYLSGSGILNNGLAAKR